MSRSSPPIMKPAPMTLAFPRPVWFRAGVWLMVFGLPPLLWSALCTAASSGVPWNAARLAPSFALAYGLPVYALRDSGLQLGWFYGPGFAIWNLPATLTQNPTQALLIAGSWNVLTWLVPVALILRAAGVARGWLAWVGAAYAGVLLIGGTVTNYAFYFIHVDALCVAAGLVACLALHRAATGGSGWWLQVAAAALAAAFWTKLIALMLAPAMFVWLWREGYRRLLSPLFFWCVIYTAVSAFLVFLYFGTQEIIFNVWLVQSLNPWRGGLFLLAGELVRLVKSCWVWLPLICFVLWQRRSAGGAKLPHAGATLVRLLIWCAVIQLPLGLTALLKAGGGLNSLHSVHYLLAALLIVAWHACTQPASAQSRVWVVPGLLWLCAVVMPLGNALVFSLGLGSSWEISHSQERLVELARKQPGRYYFPWNPLVTLIADRRVQPLDDALYCLWLVGLEPPADKIRAAVPAQPIILYEEPAQSHFALRYFTKHGGRTGDNNGPGR
jgi:hypothetical protein